MKIVEKYVTKNPCYTAGRKITVKGLMLHSVGCPQPKASVFINTWNNAAYKVACVHGVIDANDGIIYQTLPWNHRGWHGGGSSNDTHIGVEMCEPASIKYTSGSSFTVTNKTDAVAAAKRTYESAVELFAKLCKDYKLDPTKPGVIVSHKEGCALGIATNHGDPEHLWKGLGLSYTMDKFRADVKKAMGGTTSTTTTSKKETAATTKKETTTSSYKVKITTELLNVRAGAGTSYAVKTTVKKNEIYTIVEEKNGWGKLKSGAGWINLKYAKKC